MQKLSFVILLFFSVHSVRSQTFNSLLAAKLQARLDSSVTAFPNTVGMSASVFYPGQGIWTGSSGVSYPGQPITTAMQFGIASNTKLFTAVAILKLAENNILQLDDSLKEWLPAFANIDSNITIRQLLSHRSGITDSFFTTTFDSILLYPTRVYTPAEVVSYVGPPAFLPGAGYNYSNINYVLAGMIAQSASGISISQLIRDSILTPLQLDSTFFDIQEPVNGTLAHRWYNGADLHDTSRISLNTAGGAAGAIFSTSGEMAQWYQALFSGGVINSNSLDAMTTFLMPGNYGLGLLRYPFFGKTTWGHAGSTLGYTSRMIYDPCMKATVCGLSNSNQSAVNGITAMLYQLLINYLPACAGSMTGSSSVCQGQSVFYMVPPIANASSYIWTLPTGVAGSSSTNSITLTFGASAVSGELTVRGINAYGNGAPSTKFITVKPLPVLSTFSTAAVICPGQSVSLNVSGAQSYLWQPGGLAGSTIAVSPSVTSTYTVTGTSSLGCTKTATKTIAVSPCTSTLNLTLFIEGYYLGSGLMNHVLQNQGIAAATITMTDSVVVELRNTFPPYSLVSSSKTILYTNGSATCFFPVTGSYYIAIKTRNGLETWSANPVSISSNSNYNFTSAASKAFGNNQSEVAPGVWALYCGDLNHDENTDLLDLTLLENEISNFQSGYYASDINGDGNVDLLDTPLPESNTIGFVFSNHP